MEGKGRPDNQVAHWNIWILRWTQTDCPQINFAPVDTWNHNTSSQPSTNAQQDKNNCGNKDLNQMHVHWKGPI